MKKDLIFVAIGGVLMGLSPAPLNAWYLAWIALIPLWIVIKKNIISGKKIILAALIWGFCYHGLALFWITGIHPMTWMGVPWLASLAIAIFCWVFIACWGSFLVVMWAITFYFYQQWVAKYLNKFTLKNYYLPVLFAVTMWCVIEELWSLTPLWWSSLSFTQSPNNLIILQLAKLSGFATITAAIVLVNLLLAEAIILVKQNSSLLILPLVCFFSLHLLGFYFYQQPITKDNQNLLNVGIVQGNIPNEIKLYPAGWRQAINGYITGYQKLAQQGVDLVITPETALPFYWQDLIQSSSNLYQVVTKAKTPILVGAFGQKKQGYTNSLFLLTGEGKTFSRYDKYKLVPLGEYIPFESVFGKIIDRLSPLDAHLIKGEANQIVNSPFGRFIVGICYESAFSHHFRRQAKAGGKFIITASNNAHYSSAMPAQHHAQDIIRAIETDRWAARATNTGYSGIVDPHGNTVWLSELNTYQLYTGEIYTRATQTLYVKYGDWLTVFLLVMTAVTLTLGITRARLTEL